MLWDYSLFDSGHGASIVSIPFTDGDEISAILQFLSVGGFSRFVLTSRVQADSISRLPFTLARLNTWFNTISKLLIYDYHVFGAANRHFFDWIDTATEEAPLVFRNCYIIELPWWGYILAPNGVPYAATTGIFVFSNCDWSFLENPDGAWYDIPGYTFGGSSSGGHSGNSPNKSTLSKVLEEVAYLLDDPNCLDYFSPDVHNEIENLIMGSYSNPCYPAMSSAELIAHALNELCARNNDLGGNNEQYGIFDGGTAAAPFFGVTEFNSALMGDKVLLVENMCERIKCIYEKVKNLPGDDSYCNSVKAIDMSLSMNFIVGVNDLGGVGFGKTIYDPNALATRIEIDIAHCDIDDPLVIADVLLHEGIHGHLRDLLVSKGISVPEGPVGNDVWLQVLEAEFDGDEEEFIAAYLVESLSKTLHALNGHRGDHEDYYGLLLWGLSRLHDGSNNLVTYGYYQHYILPDMQEQMSFDDWILAQYGIYKTRMQTLGFEITFGNGPNDCP